MPDPDLSQRVWRAFTRLYFLAVCSGALASLSGMALLDGEWLASISILAISFGFTVLWSHYAAAMRDRIVELEHEASWRPPHA